MVIPLLSVSAEVDNKIKKNVSKSGISWVNYSVLRIVSSHFGYSKIDIIGSLLLLAQRTYISAPVIKLVSPLMELKPGPCVFLLKSHSDHGLI